MLRNRSLCSSTLTHTNLFEVLLLVDELVSFSNKPKLSVLLFIPTSYQRIPFFSFELLVDIFSEGYVICYIRFIRMKKELSSL